MHIILPLLLVLLAPLAAEAQTPSETRRALQHRLDTERVVELDDNSLVDGPLILMNDSTTIRGRGSAGGGLGALPTWIASTDRTRPVIWVRAHNVLVENLGVMYECEEGAGGGSPAIRITNTVSAALQGVSVHGWNGCVQDGIQIESDGDLSMENSLRAVHIHHPQRHGIVLKGTSLMAWNIGTYFNGKTYVSGAWNHPTRPSCTGAGLYVMDWVQGLSTGDLNVLQCARSIVLDSSGHQHITNIEIGPLAVLDSSHGPHVDIKQSENVLIRGSWLSITADGPAVRVGGGSRYGSITGNWISSAATYAIETWGFALGILSNHLNRNVAGSVMVRRGGSAGIGGNAMPDTVTRESGSMVSQSGNVRIPE